MKNKRTRTRERERDKRRKKPSMCLRYCYYTYAAALKIVFNRNWWILCGHSTQNHVIIDRHSLLQWSRSTLCHTTVCIHRVRSHTFQTVQSTHTFHLIHQTKILHSSSSEWPVHECGHNALLDFCLNEIQVIQVHIFV